MEDLDHLMLELEEERKLTIVRKPKKSIMKINPN